MRGEAVRSIHPRRKHLPCYPIFWFLPLFLFTPGSPAAAPDYAAVDALFAKHCLDCHASQEPEGKLVLESFEALMKGGESGKSVVPGKSAESLLVKAVETGIERDGKLKIMPPGKRARLQADDIAVLKGWIDAGALAPQGDVRPRELVVPKIAPTTAPRRAIQAMAYSPALKLLAVGRHGEVELFSPESRVIVRTLTGHRGAVNALVFSTDGKTLASAAGEPALVGEAKLWSAADGRLLRTIEGHRDALYSIALSPDGRTLATGSYDQKIKLWEVESGKEFFTLSAHNGAIFDLAFRPDGKVLASASGDRTVKLWNVTSGKRLETFNQPLKEQFAVAWSASGRRLAAAGADNRIRIWEIAEAATEGGNPLRHSKFAHEGAVLNLVFSPDGKSLLSSADDGTLKLWDAAAVAEKLAFATQPDVPPALAFLAEGKSIAVGRLDGTLEIYDTDKGKPVPAPAPGLSGIEPRGLQRGVPVLLKLSGTNLAGITNVLASNPKLRVGLLPGPKTGLAHVTTEAAVDLPRGAYEISVRGPGGESGKVKVFVDDLRQVPEVQATNAATLPVSFWGVLDTPADNDELPFQAKAGETLVFDLAVKSVGSKIANPSVTVVAPDGTVLGSERGFDGGDRLLVWRVPVDGRYAARVADAMLGSSKDHFYRLSVGALPVVTGVFPLSVGTNTEPEVELIGVNLPADARARVKAGAPGEVDVPVDAEKIRFRRAFKVLAAEGPQLVEQEPNDTPAQAGTVPVPGAVNGRIQKVGQASSLPSVAQLPAALLPDPDLFRFDARSNQTLILETDAARRGSPIDTRIEVLHPDGQPVTRLLLQAVRNSAITFRGIDSTTTDCRVENWEEMELNEFLHLQGEVVRLFRAPQGPDSGFLFYAGAGGKRRTYFDTSATAHALDEPCYIVEPRAPGTKLAATGLPVFTLHYANDDDGERQLGSDSRLYFTAPTNGSYLVRVSDTRGQGGDVFGYRLVLREARPDFKVTLGGANPTVAPGSGQSFTVTAERIDGFDGEIQVKFDGLPPGFSASTPLILQAGHSEAKGTLHAALDAPKPGTNGTKATATAMLGGKRVTKDVNNLGTIQLGAKPKLWVALEAYDESAIHPFNPTNAASAPLELTLAPGSRVPAWLKIHRHGHADLVTFFVEGLPHGVIVDDIGLNGVLIPKGESERQIFLNCAKWVPEQDHWCYAIEQQAGKQTSRPVLLKVRRPVAGQAAR